MLERIGNCRIVEEMAAGGMAVVYRAIQDGLNRTVAIKALKTAVAAEEHLVMRFEREAQSLAKLQHENIIHIYDFHRERGALFIVMEYVQGIDLYDLLERCGKLPYDVAAIIAMQVARALDYIHYRGILHRDIKPANIMVSRPGGVKLMDFGIVQDRSLTDLTQTGTGIGTPAYMSPEQILGDRLDARSDIFSLGIVLYQMVTGQKPFVEDEERSVMHKIRLAPHIRPLKLNPEVPRELDRIIDKCLQKQPRDRWRSAQPLIMALERFLARHVEMNYHSRLVEFLRDQEVIPQFEAKEYLNPALSGPPSGSSTPPGQVLRRTLRRGLFTQGAIFLAAASLIAIIHLSRPGTAQPIPTSVPPARGFVRFTVLPWGHIAVDGHIVATTPMAPPIEIAAGAHELTITNDFFEPYETRIEVPENSPDTPLEVRLDLEALGTRVTVGDSAAPPSTPGRSVSGPAPAQPPPREQQKGDQ